MMSNESLSSRTANMLRENITTEYTPGQKLPNENQLSEKYGVSRTTLREAIRMLVTEGILSVERGRGTFVTEAIDRYASEVDYTTSPSLASKITLRDLFEARMIIEPQAAFLAAKRASDEEIENILKLGDAVQEEIRKNAVSEQRVTSEILFHGAIIKASHNRYLNSFLSVLDETIRKTFELNENMDNLALDAYDDHRAILGFLKKRDANALKSAVIIHLHHAVANENLPNEYL